MISLSHPSALPYLLCLSSAVSRTYVLYVGISLCPCQVEDGDDDDNGGDNISDDNDNVSDDNDGDNVSDDYDNVSDDNDGDNISDDYDNVSDDNDGDNVSDDNDNVSYDNDGDNVIMMVITLVVIIAWMMIHQHMDVITWMHIFAV